MKHIKKLASLLLALVMVLSLAVTAFADEPTTYSITINNSTAGHTYEAYQIFTGDLHEVTTGEGEAATTTKVLSNIVWGSGVSEEGKTALQNKYDTAETKSAAGVAAALTNDNAVQFAKDAAGYLTTTKVDSTYSETNKNYTISGLAAGYYLVKDKDGSLTGDSDSYTEYIIQVVGNVTATPKSDVPEVQKKVKDINDSTDTTKTDWQDSADYDIGDSIPFQLKATLADNVSSYTTYKVVFHDTLSKGLTLNATYGEGQNANVVTSGVTVKVGDADKTANFVITAVKNADGTTTLTVSCDDVKALGAGNSSVITVEYNATLNGNAVLGSDGNPNEVYLEYSNNPNKSEEGNNETGNTPEDTVIVFTYKTIINKVTKNPDYDPKVDGSEEYIPLPDAEFTLEKKILGDDPTTTDKVEAEYWKAIAVVKSNNGTTFTFSGLDDGQYKLTETKTPAGYNTIDPIYFVIEATHDATAGTPALTVLKAYLTDENGNKKTEVKDGETVNIDLGTVDLTAGSITTTVVNKSGSELPSTGGMGTTIFYVLGGVLVLAAVVLLVTKKRMSGAEK